MDRELLIEIGCEEIPAGWLPALTRQVGEQLDATLKTFRLETDARTESYSTPRRLTARVAKLAERQEDFEELVTGPPLSAAFRPDGEPTPAAAGFARKYNVDVSALERHETPKGTYLAYRVHQRGKATVDVLADVMTVLLRSLTFPKQMRWDAYLEDGKGELVFARPIRWLVLLYGSRVVPFVIRRTEIAQGPTVQDIRSGSNTYGHRFLTTSGRAGRVVLRSDSEPIASTHERVNHDTPCLRDESFELPRNVRAAARSAVVPSLGRRLIRPRQARAR